MFGYVLSNSVVSESLRCHGLQLPGSSFHRDSPGKNTGMSCHAPLQGIFQTQESNPGLPQCRHILYHLSCQGTQEYWSDTIPGKFPTQGLNQSLQDCRQILYQLNYHKTLYQQCITVKNTAILFSMSITIHGYMFYNKRCLVMLIINRVFLTLIHC